MRPFFLIAKAEIHGGAERMMMEARVAEKKGRIALAVEGAKCVGHPDWTLVELIDVKCQLSKVCVCSYDRDYSKRVSPDVRIIHGTVSHNMPAYVCTWYVIRPNRSGVGAISENREMRRWSVFFTPSE